MPIAVNKGTRVDANRLLKRVAVFLAVYLWFCKQTKQAPWERGDQDFVMIADIQQLAWNDWTLKEVRR